MALNQEVLGFLIPKLGTRRLRSIIEHPNLLIKQPGCILVAGSIGRILKTGLLFGGYHGSVIESNQYSYTINRISSGNGRGIHGLMYLINSVVSFIVLFMVHVYTR